MLKNSGYGYSDYEMFNSIWTCIGPTSRLDLINTLTIVYYLQCMKVYSCKSAFMRLRASARVYL